MTLVLAINVFQVVLVENTPATGNLSLLAYFTVANTALLCGHGGHSILISVAYKYYTYHKAISDRTKELINDKSALAAVVRIQRMFRQVRLRADWRARQRERARRSLTDRAMSLLRRRRTAPVGSYVDGQPRASSQFVTLRRMVGIRNQAPADGAGVALSGINTIENGEKSFESQDSQHKARTRMNVLLKIEAARLIFGESSSRKLARRLGWSVVTFWVSCGDQLYMVTTLVTFIVYTCVIFAPHSAQ